jgi:hypothetical protein
LQALRRKVQRRNGESLISSPSGTAATLSREAEVVANLFFPTIIKLNACFENCFGTGSHVFRLGFSIGGSQKIGITI